MNFLHKLVFADWNAILDAIFHFLMVLVGIAIFILILVN